MTKLEAQCLVRQKAAALLGRPLAARVGLRVFEALLPPNRHLDPHQQVVVDSLPIDFDESLGLEGIEFDTM